MKKEHFSQMTNEILSENFWRQELREVSKEQIRKDLVNCIILRVMGSP